MQEKDTDELFSELEEDEDIRCFLSRNQKEFLPPLHEYLDGLLTKKHLRKMDVVRRSQLERSYAYHIFSGTKPNPSRTKLLSIALAMELNLEETQYLLRYAEECILYPRNPWDSIIISAITQGLSVRDTNTLLAQMGEEQLLG